MRLKQYLTEAISKYAVLGVNQDMDVCDVCGKVGLKKVVWFSELNSQGEKVGNPFCTGVDCAAILMTQTQGKPKKKPPKRMMDNIWKVAQGLEYVRKWMKKYQDEKGLKAILNSMSVKYPLSGEIAYSLDGTNTPLGLIVWDLTDTDSMFTFAINGKEKRWPEKTPMRAGRNWINMVTR